MTGLLDRLMKLRPSSGEAPARSESEAQLRAIFRTIVDAIVVIDGEGRILDFNPAASGSSATRPRKSSARMSGP